MTFKELQVASYLYRVFSREEKNYIDLANKKYNLEKSGDVAILLKFLNAWGCRQFKKEDHSIAASSLQNWSKKNRLPAYDSLLISQDENKIRKYENLFDDLKESHASTKIRGSRLIKNTVGPVGAAKSLFALRKHTFPPWDNPIITYLKLTKDGKGYCEYLLIVKEELLKLKISCESEGIVFNDIPTLLNRPHASLVKLIDEFFWLTITQKCFPAKIIKLINSKKVAIAE